MFSIPFRVTYHQILGKEIKLNLLFKLWYSNSNFALNLDYFNPASNNPVLALTPYFALRGFSPCTAVFPFPQKLTYHLVEVPGGLRIWNGWKFWIKALKETDMGMAQAFFAP